MTSICHSLSLHDALPISVLSSMFAATEPHIALPAARPPWNIVVYVARDLAPTHLGLALYIETFRVATTRSEEHTSELQSPCNLVCRLLLEKKNIPTTR